MRLRRMAAGESRVMRAVHRRAQARLQLRLEPGFSIVTFARSYPFGRAEDRERYLAGRGRFQ
jgi:hypothetical protein